jgi:DNA-binding GntR family transcriptional regulator
VAALVPQGGSTQDRVTLSQQAYDVIRNRILKGEIGLGEPLSRRKLAVELRMSLIPVSEALQALEKDGLVESRPRVGTRVCLPAEAEIRERYDIREALESQAARLYAERASPREKREMERMAQHMDALFSRCNPDGENDRDFLYAVHGYHLDLHLRIAEYARSNALRGMIEQNHVLIFNWLFDVAASRPTLPSRFHHDLIQALNSGKVDVADRAMRQHIRHGLPGIIDRLGTTPKNRRFQRVK